jgi:cobyrinic acid a,c-diamide synthase
MSGVALPAVDRLYIGGGFPETHARALGANTAFIQSLRDRIMGGMPVYAECGGLIYLSDSIIAGGERFPMAGIFPFVFELSKRPEAHGYTEFIVETDNPFYRNGTCVRGHEFRYSRLVNPEVVRDVRTVFSMKRGTGIACGRDGALFKNTLATFSHTHTLTANADWAEGLASTALRMKVE